MRLLLGGALTLYALALLGPPLGAALPLLCAPVGLGLGWMAGVGGTALLVGAGVAVARRGGQRPRYLDTPTPYQITTPYRVIEGYREDR